MLPSRIACIERWNPASGRVRSVSTKENASGGRVPPGATSSLHSFSLVEVIIAVGLFATSVMVVLALLPALTRHGAITQDTLAASRLPDAVKVELSRLAAAGGFDVLAGQTPVMGSSGGGLAFVATHDVSRLQSRDYLRPAAGQIPDAEQYFLVECWRFPDEPLRYDAQKHFLASAVRVTWPYRLPGSSVPTAETARTQATFTVSLTR